MTKNLLKPKISIIGAGNVGMRYAYALAISGLARQINILDINKEKAEGEVLDLSHGAPYYSPVEIVYGEYDSLANSDLIVITTGKNQKPEQTRLELVKENVALYKNIIPAIMKYSPSSIILVVTNPVDVLAYTAFKLSGKPSKEVISSGTVLDSARLRFLLSKHFEIDAHNVHAYILGEHGDSEFPAYSSATVGGIHIKDYCLKCGDKSCNYQDELARIFKEVKSSAYGIIKRKGETSYGIGLALVRITSAIIKDENSVLPVSNLINGYLGIKDVYLSIPAIVNKGGVREVLDIKLDSKEEGQLINSANVLKNIIKDSGM
ncbi:MAG: L-lactate dehydrogenase [Candidatus Firestonebacteria bacterium RIFOXYA2_FULL_40_8]|nr:MAG: L-lactate dehydrogenase [Candidatus Firestonebacteria bacterium RIFOXYA2_FULL_40_8]